MEVVASRDREFILTSNQDFTELLRSSWVFHTLQL